NYTLIVVCPPVTVLPATLPDGASGVAYSQLISATGGIAPHTFAITSGTLPDGVTLSTTGLLSGTLTSAGTNSFQVTATDTHGCTGTSTYALNVPSPVYEGFAYPG